MDYKVETTLLASKDLDNIIDYIENTLFNQTAAISFLDEVDDCYINLAKTPLMCECCRNPRLNSLGYRRAVIKHYVMVYKVNESRKNVTVLRFFYGASDYEEWL